MSQYVCAFRGRRDNYQIPLALVEKGLLNQLITDFYAVNYIQKVSPLLPKKWQNKISFRLESNIPVEQVKCLWGSAVLEQTRHYLGFSPATTFAWLDQNFAEAAASQARKTKSNLLLYTPYAWEAFIASYQHNPRKILFEFHPHPEVEIPLLAQDLIRFPFVQESYLEQTGAHLPEKLIVRVKECWRHADIILCASSFTKQTLVAAGAEHNSCKVIPYGIDLPVLPLHSFKLDSLDSFQALFVGSGCQRKGLHHLLYAWQKAHLPKESLLTLVCRYLDPGMESLVSQTPRVRLIRGIDAASLRHLYHNSSLFVMPSLTEGFGQVFLEALSYGCPVLGTANTCLPDLGREEDGIFLTEVGNLDHLISQLEYLSNFIPATPEIRKKARFCAERFPWKSFRDAICRVL
ncbi:hypothetical protein DSM106972_041990 [Dulcicalothrix desertica PCC 7102]|uniref:Glycosyl transferase family 1 domain-containing protein n=2 Tax=Dulcicalothrix desertica TaxID=32056 RepID=A0A3S1CJ90_9CYAN|nr:hypothetical protein DSM106972_041990 [Dulcicalothrix desertica PCC 7102]TWH42636.1 glycosyltransferase involved in cell wall biosynthesis [Dulcicalothrix desertica PCC 7102]